MKKYNLNLKENEEMIVDVDDLMETELTKFKETIKDLTEEDIKLFGNWVKIYKLLNYDIIEGLTFEKVYRFNDYSAVIELTFRGNKEYDLLNLNPETMTVACMNVKNNSVRPYVVRRLLIPDTVEEALSFAKSELPQAGIESVAKTIKDLEANGEKYNVTKQIKIYDPGFEKAEKEETQTTNDSDKTTEAQEEQKPTEEPKPQKVNNQFKETIVKADDNIIKAHTRTHKLLAAKNEDGTINRKKYLASLRG